MLKALQMPSKAKEFTELARTALSSYQLHSGDIVNDTFEEKLVRLVLLLMMARVDGKSPVEYLKPKQQQKVRDFVYQELGGEAHNFDTLINKWLEHIRL